MKPMLAATVRDETKLKFPLYGSPKIDGVRAIISSDGRVLSRTLKEIPNKWVQVYFGQPRLARLDGELVYGPPNTNATYRHTMSYVMRHDTEPPAMALQFHVFDRAMHYLTYDERRRTMSPEARDVCLVEQTMLSSLSDLKNYEEEILRQGYEGIMLRTPDGKYKSGRSTLKEGYLMKLKRFEDGEAFTIGVLEEMENLNEPTKDNLGRTKRSSHKANKHGKGRAGALVCKDMKTGIVFNIGTGLSDDDKNFFWKNRDKSYLIRYKSFDHGTKDKPRHGVYLGLRDKRDIV